ncbi:dihydrofolate reductase family protein [Jiangella asiatica]|uniref:Deaminase n=1 Tax=Jiangella asiatica TaxID=2530372 RepID=A0A4R5DAH5_9ACTN|nr:dihydrofolate reductase family protein [Jiangella asiatica]TDE08444.1 deaminase [Jiangella asiatica]
MGSIAVHEFISLDGFFQDPSWTADYGFLPEMGEALGPITDAATAILLGRTTYEMFAPAWSNRTVEDDEGAPFFNDTPKYVVGSTAPNVDWPPLTRLGSYDPAKIAELKADIDGGIFTSGSGTLVRAMLRDELVDDLHLFVYPIVLGTGKRFWGESADPTRFALKGQQVFDNGVVHLHYGPA